MTDPSATAVATDSVNTSLPRTSCTVSVLKCYIKRKLTTEDFSYKKKDWKCSWIKSYKTFYLKGSQKSCPHQGIHFGSHSCEKKREIGKQKIHPMTFSDMLLCHVLQQQKSGLLQTRYIMWKAFMLEYWNYYPVCDERPKSPIEKRKRNLKLFSPISRGEGEI